MYSEYNYYYKSCNNIIRQHTFLGVEKWVGRVGGVQREPLSMMNSTNLAPEMKLHPLIATSMVSDSWHSNKACQSSTERNTYKTRAL